ncbi:hypothetical protein [Gordonia alkanivorans]|nr:hypothetical protein [Gordonia alkanivorans]
MELALTGLARPGSFFAQWGLVNYAVDRDFVFSTAVELARKVTASGALAAGTRVEIVRRAYDWPEDEAWHERRVYATCHQLGRHPRRYSCLP